MRPLPDLSRGRHRRLPSRQLRPRRRRLWLCRYGRMDRRTGRLRDGALRRLQPAEVSGQGARDEKIRDLTCLSDILPTGFHGAVTAKVGVGSTVYVAGAGPVGLAAAASARILGAATVLIGDTNQERLAHATRVAG